MTEDLPGFHFGSWSKRLMPLGRIVRVPPDMRRKQTLMELLATGLSLPKEFAWHWDSFCDCLKDLSWLEKPPQAAIVHADIPFLQNSAQRAPYFAALREATEWWARQGTGELIVAFPAADEAEVRQILDEIG